MKKNISIIVLMLLAFISLKLKKINRMKRILLLSVFLSTFFLTTTSFKSTNDLCYFYITSNCANCNAKEENGVYFFISDIIYADYNDYKKGQGAYYNQMGIDYPKEYINAHNGLKSARFSTHDDAKVSRQETIARWKRDANAQVRYVSW